MSHATVSDLPRFGDKKNSAFFEEYLQKIYERRAQAGIDDLLTTMRAVAVQTQTGDALQYLAELYVMTPYRYLSGYVSETHTVHILRITSEYPDFIVLEPRSSNYTDHFTHTNIAFPRAAEKPNTRYIGEIYHCKNTRELQKILEAQEMRFVDNHPNSFLNHNAFLCTEPSYFTGNMVLYTEEDLESYDQLGLGEPLEMSGELQRTLETSDQLQHEHSIANLIVGIDHMATRVLCGDREHAILEFMTLTNYYFWGAYNIEDMNSSTNVTRNPNVDYELKSPAKVFTANNTPFYVKSIDALPSPTEDFVRNFGKRLHHIAYEVPDGEQADGMKNIDFVVRTLNNKLSIPFLAKVIGECTDNPDLKQIFSKSSQWSFLITEYVQRCKKYQGFFSKTNVAALTEAAGMDEAL